MDNVVIVSLSVDHISSTMAVKLLVSILLLLGCYSAAVSAITPGGEPNYQEYAKMARYLVHRLGG